MTNKSGRTKWFLRGGMLFLKRIKWNTISYLTKYSNFLGYVHTVHNVFKIYVLYIIPYIADEINNVNNIFH